jgi:hypothetical protein
MNECSISDINIISCEKNSYYDLRFAIFISSPRDIVVQSNQKVCSSPSHKQTSSWCFCSTLCLQNTPEKFTIISLKLYKASPTWSLATSGTFKTFLIILPTHNISYTEREAEKKCFEIPTMHLINCNFFPDSHTLIVVHVYALSSNLYGELTQTPTLLVILSLIFHMCICLCVYFTCNFASSCKNNTENAKNKIRFENEKWEKYTHHQGRWRHSDLASAIFMWPQNETKKNKKRKQIKEGKIRKSGAKWNCRNEKVSHFKW